MTTDWKALAEEDPVRFFFGVMTALSMALSAVGWILAATVDPAATVMAIGCAIPAVMFAAGLALILVLDSFLEG